MQHKVQILWSELKVVQICNMKIVYIAVLTVHVHRLICESILIQVHHRVFLMVKCM